MISNCNEGLELVAFRPNASVSHGPTDSLDLHMVDCGYQAQAQIDQVIQMLWGILAWLRGDGWEAMSCTQAPTAVLQAGL
jgi:hypothetical protein